jgi:nitrogen fixation/metabolism regulation signal transduction histidine kinase
LNGLWVLLGENVGTGNAFSSAQDGNLKSEFRRIASNTNIDFNVYDENGQLYYSSQPRIFEQGIVSDRINPEALHELIAFRRTQFIHPERIGTLNYIAAYAPFVSEKGTMTGFLQLPYFEKQKERNREVSGFLSALLNIYVLLFALAVFIAALISSRITQPLTVIQERMSAMRFGRTNEPIAYSADDEIGQLVNEYNRMLQELAESADKLARSERESAWREMAKQVAHEIKNPLTPMKLSVQHLQRAWTDHRDDREQMTLKMAQTLIQQIDTLSAIATEFSNFAKMPQAAPQALTISDVLRQTITLFSGSSSHEFRLNMPDQPLKVYADKDHLNRVFSNLIKNAVQAIPDDRQGVISVSLQEVEGFAEMNVQDNGSGIPQEQFDRIFMPNFTTKNSGTGLGLAMVKNIVEQGGGSVRFVSEVGIGSTFTVRWPLAGGLFS